MFYSKYSDYFPEQIMSEKYKEVSSKIIEMAEMSEDESVIEKIKRNFI